MYVRGGNLLMRQRMGAGGGEGKRNGVVSRHNRAELFPRWAKREGPVTAEGQTGRRFGVQAEWTSCSSGVGV